MTLCKNREGFGPHSRLHSNLPTTCFEDTIVIPLATWIYLVLLVIALPLAIRRPESTKDRERPGLLKRIIAVIYYLLIVAMLAMAALEIARLSVAELGIGLLPFTFVGTLAAGATHFFFRSWAVRGASALFWTMLIVAIAIKVATYAKEGGSVRVGRQHDYPVSDDIIDNAVMVGVGFFLAIFELVAR